MKTSFLVTRKLCIPPRALIDDDAGEGDDDSDGDHVEEVASHDGSFTTHEMPWIYTREQRKRLRRRKNRSTAVTAKQTASILGVELVKSVLTTIQWNERSAQHPRAQAELFVDYFCI